MLGQAAPTIRGWLVITMDIPPKLTPNCVCIVHFQAVTIDSPIRDYMKAGNGIQEPKSCGLLDSINLTEIIQSSK